jgi:hypothetical protein
MSEKKETLHICNKETEIELIKNNFEYMKKDVSEVKDLLKEFITTANEKFVSKEEFKYLICRTEKLEKGVAWFILIILSIVLT